MAQLNEKEIKQIELAVDSYNNSPWINKERDSLYDSKNTLKRAATEGVDVILKQIKRADVALFHKEEGLCGNI